MSSDHLVIINCRDRVSALRQLVAWLEQAGHERIVLLDNDSSFPDLLDYLAETTHRVVRLGRNLGSRAPWSAGLVPDEPFVYTDPDVVPIDDCPPDAVEYLAELLERHPHQPKAGLGLYLDDVPEDMPAKALEWERSLVSPQREIEPGVFDSLIDTTFALYRPGATFGYAGLRCGWPYQARHASQSWYGGHLTEEDRYYLSRATPGPMGSSWAEVCS